MSFRGLVEGTLAEENEFRFFVSTVLKNQEL